MRLTRVTPVSLTSNPDLTGKPLFPTLQQLAAEQAGDTAAANNWLPPDVQRAWSAVQWVLGHGLPHHLTGAQNSARAISRMR